MNVTNKNEDPYQTFIQFIQNQPTTLYFDAISKLSSEVFAKKLDEDPALPFNFLSNVKRIEYTPGNNPELLGQIASLCENAELVESRKDIPLPRQELEQVNLLSVSGEKALDALRKLPGGTKTISFRRFKDLQDSDFVNLLGRFKDKYKQLERLEFEENEHLSYDTLVEFIKGFSQSKALETVKIRSCKQITVREKNLLENQFKDIKFEFSSFQAPNAPLYLKKAKLESDNKAKFANIISTLDQGTKFLKFSPQQLDDEQVFEIIKKGCQLHRLYALETVVFSGHKTLSRRTVEAFLKSTNSKATLKQVELYNCENISEDDYEFLQDNYPGVQFFYYDPKPTDPSEVNRVLFEHISKRVQKSYDTIESLSLQHIPGINGKDALILSEMLLQCKCLKTLTFSNFTQFEESTIKEIEMMLTQLERLHFEPVTGFVKEQPTIKLNLSEHAASLTCECEQFTRENREMLMRVNVLIVSNIYQLSKRGLVNIILHAPHLSEFHVEGGSHIVDDEVINTIKKVRVVKLENCPGVRGDFIKAMDKTKPLELSFKKCNGLENKHLHGLSEIETVTLEIGE